jgi:hypothetical protein
MRKNICFGTIEIKDKKTNKIIENAVFTEGATHYKEFEIVKLISIKFVGKTNASKDFTEVKASNEKRNNKTGAYE